jgi:hypothetical protein
MQASENKIALRNKDGKVIAYTLCSPEDFKTISQTTWHLTATGYAGTNRSNVLGNPRIHFVTKIRRQVSKYI